MEGTGMPARQKQEIKWVGLKANLDEGGQMDGMQVGWAEKMKRARL